MERSDGLQPLKEGNKVILLQKESIKNPSYSENIKSIPFIFSELLLFLSVVIILTNTRKEFTKEINKVKPSMKSIPFISVYNLTERTERSVGSRISFNLL